MKSTWLTIKDILNSTKKKNNYPEAFWINGELISDKVVLANQFKLIFLKYWLKYCIPNSDL